MVEEVRDAARVVPRIIVLAISINGVMGFAMLLVMLYCLTNLDMVLSTPTGYPFMAIFLEATNSVAGTAVLSCIVIVLYVAASTAILAATSRLLWAFSRDRAVPAWSHIAKV
jgi:amino acid transporter